jgi:hypothetical protein
MDGERIDRRDAGSGLRALSSRLIGDCCAKRVSHGWRTDGPQGCRPRRRSCTSEVSSSRRKFRQSFARSANTLNRHPGASRDPAPWCVGSPHRHFRAGGNPFCPCCFGASHGVGATRHQLRLSRLSARPETRLLTQPGLWTPRRVQGQIKSTQARPRGLGTQRSHHSRF